MILKSYKELLHFCTKRFEYLFYLSVVLTPATIIDAFFEESNNIFLSSIMDIASSVISFMVVAYLYVHWHEHKKFIFVKFLETSLQKLYPTLSAYIWVIIFILVPFVLLWTLSRVFVEFTMFKANGSLNFEELLYSSNGSLKILSFLILALGGYFALKATFSIYFAYKTSDKTGYSSIKKSLKINFVEVIQYIITIGIYFAFYSLALFAIGYIWGVGMEYNAKYIMTTNDSSSIFHVLMSFFITMLNIPFEVLYVAFAYHLYEEYTK
jgi:hypothetical protein